jgi:DNA repair protein RecO (recombination protein O)
LIQKTEGIVFRFTKYGETSIIVTIFTKAFGLQSYIVNGVRSKSAKNKIALFQPLTILNLVVYHRENANIERIKELNCAHPYSSMTTDIRKSSIAMFINEVLNKTVKEESHAGAIFDFIKDSLITLDTMTEYFENFHLIFLIKLSRFLGFGIQNINQVIGGKMSTPEEEEVLTSLLNTAFTQSLSITNAARRGALDLLVNFYLEHIETMGELKSLHVLKEVLQ